MNTRYYVVFIQYNKDVGAENRTVPSAFNDFNNALQKFHEQLGKDMKNSTLGWSIGFILDNNENMLRCEKWFDEKWLSETDTQETED